MLGFNQFTLRLMHWRRRQQMVAASSLLLQSVSTIVPASAAEKGGYPSRKPVKLSSLLHWYRAPGPRRSYCLSWFRRFDQSRTSIMLEASWPAQIPFEGASSGFLRGRCFGRHSRLVRFTQLFCSINLAHQAKNTMHMAPLRGPKSQFLSFVDDVRTCQTWIFNHRTHICP